MRRRTVLATLGTTLLAGCVSGPADEDASPTGTPTGSTASPPSTADENGYAVTEFDVSTTKVAPTEPYYLRTTKSYSAEAVADEPGEQTVVDVADVADPDLRATVKAVLSEGKVWRDEIPDGLESLVQRVDFFTWEARSGPEATWTHWAIAVYRAHPERDPVLAFDAELVDDRVAPADPGAVSFSVTNEGDRPQTVFSGTVPPFSVLWADAPADGRSLLWRDYTEEGCVNFVDHDGETAMVTCSIGVSTEIAPGETVTRRYELPETYDEPALPDAGFDAPGRYVVDETLEYHRAGASQGPSTQVDWRVAMSLERA